MSRRTSRLRRLRRRLDRRFYRCLFRLYRTLFPTPAWPGRISAARLRRILIVRHDRVGDMVLTTPLLGFLKDAAPEAEIDVLASPRNAPLVAGDPRVARVFTNDHSLRAWLRLLPRLRARRYDAVFSLLGVKGLREGLVASLVARQRTYKISVWRPIRYHGLFTRVVRMPRDVAHAVEHLLYVGWSALGTGAFRAALAERYPMRLAIDEPTRRRAAAFLSARGVGQFALVNLAAAETWREWQPDRCVAVVELLLRRHAGLSVVLDSPPGKERLAGEVARQCGGARVVVAPTSARILDLAAIVERASIVLTPNTAVVHLASASGRPVVGLYTLMDGDVRLWLPFRVPYRALFAGPGQSVSDIAPEAITRAFDELWAEVSAAEQAVSGVAP